MNLPELMSEAEAAAALGVGEGRLRELWIEGRAPAPVAWLGGRGALFDAAHVREFQETNLAPS